MEKNKYKVRVIAFYLPQFHPTPENDKWWGKGFTEWTNVGKAKPLFKGHYQPKVPADLGYYDLRVPETRREQAELARQYGIEGFCYWHYWFGNGRQLLQRPFQEVLASGEPDFPFCLAWANHSWEDKQFNKEGGNKMLMEQLYPGDEDYIAHFNAVLPAFKDPRYIRVNGEPLFMIYAPMKVPDIAHFIELWQKLAEPHGFRIHFVGHTSKTEELPLFRQWGFNATNLVRLFDVFQKNYSLLGRIKTKFQRITFHQGQRIDYERAARYFSGPEDQNTDCYPTLIPNWDHSPRSGRSGHILINSTPKKFEEHAERTFRNVIHKPKEERIVFLKSWNEWAEGNYINNCGNVSSMGSILIFNVGVDLVEVGRMQGLFIKLLLQCLAVILGIQNEDFFAKTQKNIGLHGREKPQHGSIVLSHKIPFDLRSLDLSKVGMILSVILQNKAFVQLCHAFIRKCCHFIAAVFGGLQHIVQHEIAEIQQHLVILVAPLIM